jgi:hypothetical protein
MVLIAKVNSKHLIFMWIFFIVPFCLLLFFFFFYSLPHLAHKTLPSKKALQYLQSYILTTLWTLAFIFIDVPKCLKFFKQILLESELHH